MTFREELRNIMKEASADRKRKNKRFMMDICKEEAAKGYNNVVFSAYAAKISKMEIT